VSDTDDNDPYRPKQPDPNAPPPPPPSSPQWGSNPPPSADQPGQFGAPGGGWTGGQLGQYGQPQYGQPQYGAPQYGGPQYGQPTGPPPANYLVWAILSTLFCCLPLGVVSIVFAAQVNSKHAAGDVAGAMDSSKKAKKFAIWSAGVSLVLVVVWILLAVGLAAGFGSA
jgi:hypothetical protein